MHDPRITHNGRVNGTTAQTYPDSGSVVLDLNTGVEGSFLTFTTREDALTVAALLIAAANETELR